MNVEELATYKRKIVELEEKNKQLTSIVKRLRGSKFIAESSNDAVTDCIDQNSNNCLEWNIYRVNKQYNRKFRASEIITEGVLKITNNNVKSIKDIIDEMEYKFEEILYTSIPKDSKPDDYVAINISNPNLDNDISVKFVKLKNFEPSLVLAEIMRVDQSKKEFLLNGVITINVTHVSVPSAGGKKGINREIDFETWKKSAKSVIKVSEDGLCCARSIVISMAFVDGIKGEEWMNLKNDINNIQTCKAIDLCKCCSVEPYVYCGIAEFMKFDAYLSEHNYRLFVANSVTRKSFIYIGKKAAKDIFILLHNSHCDSLISIKSFLQCSYFCRFCAKGYQNKYDHRCNQTCSSCFGEQKCANVSSCSCKVCHRKFADQLCFKTHIEKQLCDKIWYCIRCNQTVKTRQHNCLFVKCPSCKKKYEKFTHHDCYMQQLNKEKLFKEDEQKKIFVFFDFESCLCKNESNEEYSHLPNLCVAQTICDFCYDNKTKQKNITNCYFCKEDLKTFYGLNACKDFCVWLFSEMNNIAYELQKEYKLDYTIKIIVISHNGKAYDTQFVLRYLINNNKIPQIIKKGNKIYRLKIGRFSFIDSVNFIPLPLKKLPKTFGLTSDVKKMWFPYLFNNKENLYYIGKWPDKSFYPLDTFSSEEIPMFNDWYETMKKSTFNLKKELISYCAMDVKILCSCVMYIRRMYIMITKLDPLTRCFTLPMFCMEVFRAFYLRQNEIPIIPYNGYEPKRKYSFMCDCWLTYLSFSDNITIEREYHIGKYFADGYNCETRTVYEFMGCLWHGCGRCYPRQRWMYKNPYNHKSMTQLYDETMEKLNYYKNNNFNIIIMWECKWNEIVKNNKSLKSFISSYTYSSTNKSKFKNIVSRDAFYGGRVNAIKLYCEATHLTKIHYFDVRSLYPFIQKNGRFPIRQPKIISVFDSTDINKYFGILMVKILPPRKLYLPLLPFRHEGKLLFPLCRMCTFTRNQGTCLHDDHERCLIGTWVTEEVKYATTKGYKIIEIYEVWHFDKSLQKDVNGYGLYDTFQNNWLKIKVENSDWPNQHMSQHEKNEYIRQYKIREGINLDENKIVDNPGMRNIGKIAANNHWGKHGAEANLRNSEIITDEYKFFELLNNSTFAVNDAYLLSDTVIMVQYDKCEDFIVSAPHSNVIIAAFTTSLARLYLYTILESLERRILYFDTDSVIFTESNNEFMPPTGNYLGDLTDEIKEKFGASWYINRFVSGGAKNYAIELKNDQQDIKYCCKVKGITLNFASEKILNFDSMLDIVKQTSNATLEVPQLRFDTNSQLNISSSIMKKKYRFLYDKRRICEDYCTLPFGYVD